MTRENQSSRVSRRDFVAASTKVAAGAALAAGIPFVHAAENNTIKIALVGCGGRGTGAAVQALSTAGPTKLWAMADFFENKLTNSLTQISKNRGEQVDVPKDRQFVGLDAYRKAIDTLGPGDVVILATPPGFRPGHLEYAVEKGVNVFMEKSFAVDAPGIRRVIKCGEVATQKNLKISGGLMSRHNIPLAQAIQQIHDGKIGEVITAWAYRVHGDIKIVNRNPQHNELAHQVSHYSNFTWLNGSFIVDWLIHNIDVCCWVMNDWPISVQGMGGRQVHNSADQLFDHYLAEYSFASGRRMLVQGRLIDGCWGFFGDHIHGTTGSAVLGEGVPVPKIYRGHEMKSDQQTWTYTGDKSNPYQVEWDVLMDAIRHDKPHNETLRCAKSNLTAIMGRMACESGQRITWDEAFNSNLELAPGLATWTPESDPPVKPDANGKYPIAMPGLTKVL